MAVDAIFYVPITRIDQDRREVEGVPTSEAVDTFGTVFDYEASKKAFSDWAGNVREMHQPKAASRKADLRFDRRQQAAPGAPASRKARKTPGRSSSMARSMAIPSAPTQRSGNATPANRVASG